MPLIFLSMVTTVLVSGNKSTNSTRQWEYVHKNKPWEQIIKLELVEPILFTDAFLPYIDSTVFGF